MTSVSLQCSFKGSRRGWEGSGENAGDPPSVTAAAAGRFCFFFFFKPSSIHLLFCQRAYKPFGLLCAKTLLDLNPCCLNGTRSVKKSTASPFSFLASLSEFLFSLSSPQATRMLRLQLMHMGILDILLYKWATGVNSRENICFLRKTWFLNSIGFKFQADLQ